MATVVPLSRDRFFEAAPIGNRAEPTSGAGAEPPKRATAPPTAAAGVRREAPLEGRTLDATWDRRLARGLIAPDAEVDLHGLGLHLAHDRLMASLAQANASGARVLLVIAGKHRPHDHHDERGSRRGAIRAKLLDWLAASPQAGTIAAIRPAHQRHGGAGAVYVVLRRARP